MVDGELDAGDPGDFLLPWEGSKVAEGSSSDSEDNDRSSAPQGR